MSNYTKTTDFEAKDSLPTGDSGKIIRGSEFETEFDAISTAIATKADTAGPTFTGTLTFETISDGTIGVTAFVDEDDMSSDSATLVPTQQSVKAYVDSQVTAQDLDFQADSGGALSIDLDSESLTLTGGTGIDTSGALNEVTFAIDSTVATLTDTQTLTNKTLTAPTISGNLTTDGTIDGRDVAADGTKLDGIEASADVTDTANVTAAGALMDSELTDITAVKSLDQGVATTDSPTFAGLTTTADVSFGDNDKAIFGAGSDLQIYHNGNHSFIEDSGTGNLYLRGTNLEIQSTTQEKYLAANADGGVKLYYNNAQKLATTSTGIDVTGVITTDGMTTSADINFGDNDKAVFGAGSDLQIYHDGSNSHIKDAGSGGLRLSTNQFRVYNAATNELSINAVENGTVELYYDDVKKLSTTSTGIDVTGTVTADAVAAGASTFTGSLTIDAAAASVTVKDSNDGGTVAFVFENNSGTTSSIRGSSSSQDIQIKPNEVLAANFASGGDISFYEDTGTTAKLFWDASAESLGIGTTSPDALLDLDAGSSSEYFRGAGNSGSARYLVLSASTTTNAGDTHTFNASSSTGHLQFATAGVDRVTIDNSGNVGIGTNSPAESLHVNGDIRVGSTSPAHIYTNANELRLGVDNNNDNSTSDITFYVDTDEKARIDSSGNVNIYGTDNRPLAITSFDTVSTGAGWDLDATSGNGVVTVSTGGTERMRIDSSGNVGIGTSSPTKALHVVDSNSGFRTTPVMFQNSGGIGSEVELRLAPTPYPNEIGSTARWSAIRAINSDVGNATDLAFLTNDVSEDPAERMRIDHDGNVGIGTSSPSYNLEVSNSGNSFLQIKSTSTSALTGLLFGDTSNAVGRVTYDHSDNSLQLFTSGSEKVRVDSSGNLLVGTTSQSASVAGGRIFSTGRLVTSVDDEGHYFRRNNSDGTIVEFAKDGTTVGSIGVSVGDLYIQGPTSNHSGLRFDTNALIPFRDNAIADGSVNLGLSNVRFKDLHLSGDVIAPNIVASNGVFLGGTSNANKLDDYEEGTWTPAYGATTNPTIGYNTQSATYTKVGNLVTVTLRIITNSRSGGVGQLFVSGLPFTAVAGDDSSATIGFNYNWVTGENPEYALVQQNTARILLYKDAKTNTSNESTDILASGNSYLYITASYFAQ